MLFREGTLAKRSAVYLSSYMYTVFNKMGTYKQKTLSGCRKETHLYIQLPNHAAKSHFAITRKITNIYCITKQMPIAAHTTEVLQHFSKQRDSKLLKS